MNTEFKPFYRILTNPRKGRRLVISDIHGFCQTFKELIKKVDLQATDQLFLLGDYIDRGPDNAGVIDFILELQGSDYQIYTVRGNHEENVITAWYDYVINNQNKAHKNSFFGRIEAKDLLTSENELYPKYKDFLVNLPYYFELDKFYLVHAGFKFNSEMPFENFEIMAKIRNFNQNPTDKTIIHGHVVTDLGIIKSKIQEKSTIIPLDNGCYYGKFFKNTPNEKETGNLCCLNLDTFELILQENVG